MTETVDPPPARAAPARRRSQIFYHLESKPNETGKGKIHTISAQAASQSKILEDLIANFRIEPISSPDTSPLQLHNMDASTVDHIVTWCTRHREDQVRDCEPTTPWKPDDVVIPAWDEDFLTKMSASDIFHVICAADYLELSLLLDYGCKIVARMAKDRTPDELRMVYCIPTDEEVARRAAELAAMNQSAAQEETATDAVRALKLSDPPAEK